MSLADVHLVFSVKASDKVPPPEATFIQRAALQATIRGV